MLNAKELETVRIVFDRLECIRSWLVDMEEDTTIVDVENRRHPTLEGEMNAR